MAMTLKSDIINTAYSKLRISGLTVVPGSEDIQLALDELETLAHELNGKNFVTGYNFEGSPDASSDHGLERKFFMPFATMLAVRVLPYFGKQPDQVLLRQSSGACSFIASATAQARQTNPPTHMPVGSGNRLFTDSNARYFPQIEQAPVSYKSQFISIDDTDDYTENYDDYLVGSEVISSYTIDADSGLTLDSDSQSGSNINYRITADTVGVYQVTIIVTTDTGRVLTRKIDFEVVD